MYLGKQASARGWDGINFLTQCKQRSTFDIHDIHTHKAVAGHGGH